MYNRKYELFSVPFKTNMDANSHLRFLPIFCVFWTFLTFATSYLMAVWDGHVYPWLPYVSETGTLPPESCIFGQMLNIGAALTGAIVYFKFMQAELWIASKNFGKKTRYLNKACLLTGGAHALGISIVANFQCTNIILIHLFGAVLAFQIGIFYMILQTILCSILNDDDQTGKKINILRAIMCVLSIALEIMMAVFAVLALRPMIVKNNRIQEAMLFDPSEETYLYRLISTTSEWALCGCLGVFILTFQYDFSYLYNYMTFVDSRIENNKRHIYT